MADEKGDHAQKAVAQVSCSCTPGVQYDFEYTKPGTANALEFFSWLEGHMQHHHNPGDGITLYVALAD